ncbi:hypothetical protein [Thermovenabulum gondwanense]|uniref:Uncharacterized protein n=1 Tax=Thermovenabulum gondwanense TaxID=520767 RepID=A0A162N089_9FIRM|nr:hypothetical protein [Thermovenabulum gondwanense]KYO68623.1 hypothetical protein ATZ99_01320 [Thermovenabulum gondwanense]
MEKSFFPMPKGDKITLVILLLYVIITFFLIKSPVKIAGLSIFGWLMALLMFIAPLLHLYFVLKEEK